MARPVDSRFKTLNVLFVIGLLLASFDIAFNIEIAGLSFRTAQIAQVLFVGLHFLTPAPKGERNVTIQPLGFKWLMFWGLFLIAWTPNTYDLGFSIAYTFYFLFAVLVIYTAAQVYGHSEQKIYILLRAYIMTFVFVAAFGLVQFVAGLFGIDLLVRQWWRVGSLPRLNGFSYEPSYYATYLITGWGMLVWMIEQRNYLYPRYVIYLSLFVVSLAIILSSSRMGIMIIGLYVAYYFFKETMLLITQLKIRKSFLKIVVALTLATTGIAMLVIVTVGIDSLQFLLFGTGIAGSADHSTAERLDYLQDTLALIRQSPVIGYGLGGVWSAIAHMNGIALDEASGMNITAEVMAASGIFGFIFFALFIGTTLYGCFRYLRKDDVLSQHLGAAGLGFILLYIILQFNQNIMRLYVWNHLAIIAILHYHVSLKRMRARSGSRPQVSRRLRKPGFTPRPS